MLNYPDNWRSVADFVELDSAIRHRPPIYAATVGFWRLTWSRVALRDEVFVLSAAAQDACRPPSVGDVILTLISLSYPIVWKCSKQCTQFGLVNRPFRKTRRNKKKWEKEEAMRFRRSERKEYLCEACDVVNILMKRKSGFHGLFNRYV